MLLVYGIVQEGPEGNPAVSLGGLGLAEEGKKHPEGFRIVCVESPAPLQPEGPKQEGCLKLSRFFFPSKKGPGPEGLFLRPLGGREKGPEKVGRYGPVAAALGEEGK
jgi:hypothetical protein